MIVVAVPHKILSLVVRVVLDRMDTKRSICTDTTRLRGSNDVLYTYSLPVISLGGVAILGNVHSVILRDRLTTTKAFMIIYMAQYTYTGILTHFQGTIVTRYMIIL